MGLHADADITGLLQQIKDSGFDYLDCLSTAPMSSHDRAGIGGIHRLRNHIRRHPVNMLVPMCCPDEAFPCLYSRFARDFTADEMPHHLGRC